MCSRAKYRASNHRRFFLRELTERVSSNDFLQEAYILVRHARFSLADVDNMTADERRFFIHARVKEEEENQEKINEARNKKG